MIRRILINLLMIAAVVVSKLFLTPPEFWTVLIIAIVFAAGQFAERWIRRTGRTLDSELVAAAYYPLELTPENGYAKARRRPLIGLEVQATIYDERSDLSECDFDNVLSVIDIKHREGCDFLKPAAELGRVSVCACLSRKGGKDADL